MGFKHILYWLTKVKDQEIFHTPPGFWFLLKYQKLWQYGAFIPCITMSWRELAAAHIQSMSLSPGFLLVTFPTGMAPGGVGV